MRENHRVDVAWRDPESLEPPFELPARESGVEEQLHRAVRDECRVA
jgi:hypothetical protein